MAQLQCKKRLAEEGAAQMPCTKKAKRLHLRRVKVLVKVRRASSKKPDTGRAQPQRSELLSSLVHKPLLGAGLHRQCGIRQAKQKATQPQPDSADQPPEPPKPQVNMQAKRSSRAWSDSLWIASCSARGSSTAAAQASFRAYQRPTQRIGVFGFTGTVQHEVLSAALPPALLLQLCNTTSTVEFGFQEPLSCCFVTWTVDLLPCQLTPQLLSCRASGRCKAPQCTPLTPSHQLIRCRPSQGKQQHTGSSTYVLGP